MAAIHEIDSPVVKQRVDWKRSIGGLTNAWAAGLSDITSVVPHLLRPYRAGGDFIPEQHILSQGEPTLLARNVLRLVHQAASVHENFSTEKGYDATILDVVEEMIRRAGVSVGERLVQGKRAQTLDLHPTRNIEIDLAHTEPTMVLQTMLRSLGGHADYLYDFFLHENTELSPRELRYMFTIAQAYDEKKMQEELTLKARARNLLDSMDGNE